MERLVRYTQIDYDREMAFVAIDPQDEQHEIRGISRYTCNPDGKTAEFGVIVEDAWQGSRRRPCADAGARGDGASARLERTDRARC